MNNKIIKYFRGVGEEARRVRWPNQRELWTAVAIVLVITIVSALSIALSDWITIYIMKAFETAFPKDSSAAETSSSAAAAAMNIVGWLGGKF